MTASSGRARRRTWSAVLMAASLVGLSGCAARAPARPAGPATADPAAVGAFERATRPCATLSTFTAEMRLSGRAGADRVRGTLHAGLAVPSSVRVEAVAPFGPPVFILAGRDNRATLLFPRDDRVLVDAAVADVLARLTGLALTASDLRLILTGCLAHPAAPGEGRAWTGGWRAVTVGSDITAYVREVNGAPAVVAADYGAWHVDYADHLNGWPRRVRIRRADEGSVDLTAALEQVQINVPIDDRAFALEIPRDAEPLTLDDLRSVAPLKGAN